MRGFESFCKLFFGPKSALGVDLPQTVMYPVPIMRRRCQRAPANECPTPAATCPWDDDAFWDGIARCLYDSGHATSIDLEIELGTGKYSPDSRQVTQALILTSFPDICQALQFVEDQLPATHENCQMVRKARARYYELTTGSMFPRGGHRDGAGRPRNRGVTRYVAESTA